MHWWPGPVLLASASPRRRDLLASVGVVAEVRPVDIDEAQHPGEEPASYVRRLAHEKAGAAVGRSDATAIIGADTTVVLDGILLGKPTHEAEARAHLEQLAGRTHTVLSGVAVRAGSRVLDALVRTEVEMASLGPGDLEWYVATGEWRDKAGGYALQGAGGALVAGVEGSVSNVIGLPLVETLDLLRRLAPDA